MKQTTTSYCEKCKCATYHTIEKFGDKGFARFAMAIVTVGFSEGFRGTEYTCLRCNHITRTGPLFR